VRRSLRPERLPIRVRVTAVFAASMAVVLAAAGAFVYYGLRTELTEALDDQLETQAAAVARLLVERAGAQPGLTEGLDDPGETFTQVIGPDGRLLTSSPGLPLRPILAPAARRAAAEGADVTLEDVPLAPDDDRDEIDVEALEETGTEPFEEDRARVIARFVDVRGERLTVLVGSTFEDRDEALRTLALILALAAPAALLLTCLVGYGAVRSALGPVELIRRRAASISARNPGERVPVPPADDELARLGRTLNDMLDRLQRALERERTFVADASHELRTPLAILRGELEVALRGSRSRAELEAAVRSAAEEAERLSEIAEGLLLLARSDRGAIPLRLEAIDARRLLEGARDRFEPGQEGWDARSPSTARRRSRSTPTRTGSSRPCRTWSRTPSATGRGRWSSRRGRTARWSSWRSATRVPASRRSSSRSRSSASAARARAARARARASASRSPRRSPPRTAARPRCATARVAAPRSSCACRVEPAELSPGSHRGRRRDGRASQRRQEAALMDTSGNRLSKKTIGLWSRSRPPAWGPAASRPGSPSATTTTPHRS
jgi:signal transduction histidine kinase